MRSEDIPAPRGPAALPRQLGLALGFGAIGALGAIPGARGPDPLAELAWIALVALPCGIACGALELRPWPFAASVPALWMSALALAGVSSERTLASPLSAALCWTGIFAAGWGIGRWTRAGVRSVAAALCFSILLSVLPSAGAFLGRPWPPRIAARLLDLSPVSVCMEAAGVDWLRHPAVYDPAGSVDVDPALRSAYRPALASSIAFVVGCALAWTSAGWARRRERRAVP